MSNLKVRPHGKQRLLFGDWKERTERALSKELICTVQRQIYNKLGDPVACPVKSWDYPKLGSLGQVDTTYLQTCIFPGTQEDLCAKNVLMQNPVFSCCMNMPVNHSGQLTGPEIFLRAWDT